MGLKIGGNLQKRCPKYRKNYGYWVIKVNFVTTTLAQGLFGDQPDTSWNENKG